MKTRVLCSLRSVSQRTELMQAPVYELNENFDDFVGLNFVNRECFSLLRAGGVGALASVPSPILVELNDEDPCGPLSDYPVLDPGCCCFSIRAWSLFQAHLDLRGPSIRLRYSSGSAEQDFVMFEPKPRFDCLDFGRSDVKFFPNAPHRVMWIDNIALRTVSAVDQDIFKVAHVSWLKYCGEKCKQLVEDHGLSGFWFDKAKVTDA